MKEALVLLNEQERLFLHEYLQNQLDDEYLSKTSQVLINQIIRKLENYE